MNEHPAENQRFIPFFPLFSCPFFREGLTVVLIRVFHLYPLSLGWPTLISVLTIGFGITNISLGIIAEYLWRTLDAARGRPVFLLDEEIVLNGGTADQVKGADEND